ncbi:hypothetical protein A2767_06295 [Candidatus Roizmanbacteria bacterium RIFCSPHIGHO2_01_FULL_35_10]|uniref:Glycosyl transferase n=1 Tax=Candidatus Roizmanbacteria bacterium RIFCSPLOWO2_01_FULL_35_13 TaxID=1802055 RepID=A0A1F7IB16_9BACT|nr:MAG: hypothetical protein A2767_06295 [Candidatus Roizmanbacteria bacterium RIFCSPHIGHO2_01_FULL_35_10]OGK40565.1 MAG: hypothetical protein A3A74_00355 [Candidatus Roizmanbacteria bacterium RIFCSPLOWO2_01_FULL_35_13]
MKEFRLLGVKINPQRKSNILEQIKMYIAHPRGYLQIVSLNPENIIEANENNGFKRILETSQLQIIDGIGVVLAGKLIGVNLERLTGVDLMDDLVKLADELSLRVLLIGGKPNLALRLAQCYSDTYAQAKFIGIAGVKNIKKPLRSEEDELFSIVTAYKPHLVFVSFGSPDQELWLDRHKKKLLGIVTMGVGGAFDYFSGKITRAPKFIRSIGMEWLFRLIVEPWRWKRQLRLIKFLWLISLSAFFRHSGDPD